MNRSTLVRAFVLFLVLVLPGCGAGGPEDRPPETVGTPGPSEREEDRPPETPGAPGPSERPGDRPPETPRAPGPSEREREGAPGSKFDTVLVVLGNEPLDDETPTVDMIARVEKAVAFRREHPGALLVFTGGPTAGSTSEARMMADLAVARGVPTESVRLEEKARSTGQNARLTAELIRKIRPERVFIVSKGDHLEWAMPIFRRFPEFRAAEPLACQVDPAECIAQMEAYLKNHDSPRVRDRLANLKKGVKGVD